MDATGTTGTCGEGNTKSSPRCADGTEVKKSRTWFFTYNNPGKEGVGTVGRWLETQCDEWHSQVEVGASGTEHLQGCFKLRNARSFQVLSKEFKWHIEPCRNWKKAIEYCSKTSTRVGDGPSSQRRVKDPMEGLERHDWQVTLDRDLQAPADPRKVIWIVDAKGAAGKTTWAKSRVLRDPSSTYVSGKAADVKYGLANMLESGVTPRVVIWDCTRSQEGFFSYEALEAVKNGIFYSTKYESKQVIYDNPHVVVLSNWAPDRQMLSEDRWDIREVTA